MKRFGCFTLASAWAPDRAPQGDLWRSEIRQRRSCASASGVATGALQVRFLHTKASGEPFSSPRSRCKGRSDPASAQLMTAFGRKRDRASFSKDLVAECES